MTELAKSFEPAAIEARWAKLWEKGDAFAPTLKPLGVVCSYEPGHPLLEDLKESMQTWMRSGRPEPRAASARTAPAAERLNRQGD